MGQSSSSSSSSTRRRTDLDLGLGNHMHQISTAMIVPEQQPSLHDYTSSLPDECLAQIFHKLRSSDRNICSLVCQRWLTVEAQSRARLSLRANANLSESIPSLFTRFDSLTKLTLKCDRQTVSIGDKDLDLISLKCRNLIRIKLYYCHEVTDVGMLSLAVNCTKLKILSCGSCNFGAKGMNAFLNNSFSIEELSVKRLRGPADLDCDSSELIGTDAVTASLKSICLKEVYNGQCFKPLIAGAKDLRTLRLYRCSGDWDEVLESVTGLVEVHLERIQVSDTGVDAISNSVNLETLHLVKTPECTDASLVSIAERCRLLRKLHVDAWKTARIGDEGMTAVLKNCVNLQELVLIGVTCTSLTLGLLGNCPKLERLALCGSDTIGDSAIACVAAKCMALRKLCIRSCPVSNLAMEALARGCAKLAKMKIKKCRGVTSDGVAWLRSSRPSLLVKFDMEEPENVDASASASASDSGLPDSAAENVSVFNEISGPNDIPPSSSNGRSSSSKAKLCIFRGRNFARCAFRRQSSNRDNSDDT